MANSVDPDQTAPSGAVWSGFALFACVILSEILVFEFLGHLPYIEGFDRNHLGISIILLNKKDCVFCFR